MISMIPALPFLLIGFSEVSMNDQTIEGTPLDPRITRCGVVVTGNAIATLRPFIETSSALSGKVSVVLHKQSVSGTSQVRQNWAFAGTTLGNSSVAVERPAAVTLQIEVTDDIGGGLCRLQKQFELPVNAFNA